MNQKGISELQGLLEGIISVIQEFSNTTKRQSEQLEQFTTTLDAKIISLNDNIAQLAEAIKEEDEKLLENLNSLINDVKTEIVSYKEEIKISDFKDILESLQKVVTIPEKAVINETIDSLMKEILEIAQELKNG